MQPSSLIFLVIIAIWAAYFLQHWVRRREHLATARSVDRFSESMRVLELGARFASPDLSEPQPRSYAVSPARPSRPQVVVKRAATQASAAPASDRLDVLDSEAASAAAPARVEPAPLATGRRARGITLLAVVTSLLVTIGLASFAIVPWPAVAAPCATLLAALVWMRRGAKADQAARREAARRQRAQANRTSEGARDRQAAPREAVAHRGETAHHQDLRNQAPQAAGTAEAEAAVPAGADVRREVRSESRDRLFDIQTFEGAAPGGAPGTGDAPTAQVAGEFDAGQSVPVAPLVDEDDIPLTWEPVPVPRPTYTMKAMAHRHPAAPVEQGVPPELADAAYEEPVRRVAGA